MNLYLISQEENLGYDTHDSAVVAAEDERAARNTHPGFGEWGENWGSWAPSPEHVTVRLLGVAEPGTEPGVILASFNAG